MLYSATLPALGTLEEQAKWGTVGTTAATAVGATTGIAASMGAAWATAAIPFVGPIIAGVTIGIGLLLNRKSGRQKLQATEFANLLFDQLRANLDGYNQMKAEGRNTSLVQQRALQNFDEAWAGLVAACGQEELGDAGKRCISERERGGKYDAFVPFRDPIANDTPVGLTNDLLGSFGTSTESLAATVQSIPQWIWLGLAGVLALKAVSD